MRGQEPISVLHVITTLDVGGAETVLLRLLGELTPEERAASQVVVVRSLGEVAKRIEALGVPVLSLDARTGFAAVGAIVRLLRLTRSERPDVIQTWMYHADLLGGFAGRLRGIKVVWGLHAAPTKDIGILQGIALRGLGILSYLLPERIVCCSEASRRSHDAFGYRESRLVTIPNGFPDPAASEPAALRTELGLPDDALVVGRIARDHPDKDIATLLKAFRLVIERRPGTHLVLVGEGLGSKNAALGARIEELGLGENVHPLGPRDKVESLNAAFDVAVSSSSTEALPLAVGEAMLAGTPAVVTDVGDSAALVGDPHRVVPKEDARSLAEALVAVLGMPPEERRVLGRRDRKRIQTEYPMDRMVSGYRELYRRVVTPRPAWKG